MILCAQHVWCPKRPQESIIFLELELHMAVEPPDVGAGNQTQNLWKDSRCPKLPNHLFIPPTWFT